MRWKQTLGKKENDLCVPRRKKKDKEKIHAVPTVGVRVVLIGENWIDTPLLHSSWEEWEGGEGGHVAGVAEDYRLSGTFGGKQGDAWPIFFKFFLFCLHSADAFFGERNIKRAKRTGLRAEPWWSLTVVSERSISPTQLWTLSVCISTHYRAKALNGSLSSKAAGKQWKQ